MADQWKGPETEDERRGWMEEEDLRGRSEHDDDEDYVEDIRNLDEEDEEEEDDTTL